MDVCNYVIRRGAVYAWRRRIPACHRALQVSLRTSCPWTARRLGGIVTVESNGVFDRMAGAGLTAAQAKAWLDHVVQRELARIAGIHAVAANDDNLGRAQNERRNDLVYGHALGILAEDGFGARIEDHVARLDDAGLSGLERAGVARDMELIRDELPVTERALQRELRQAVGLEKIGPLAWMQARQIYLRGRSAAYLAQDSLRQQTQEDDAAQVLALARRPVEKASVTVESQPPAAAEPLKATTATAAPAPELNDADNVTPDFYASLPAVAERLIRRKQRAGMQDKEAGQIRGLAALFVEATGVSDITLLRQSGCARFRDILGELPADYRKSPRERAMALADIITAAKDQPGRKIGLSAATVNRTLGHLGQIIAQARAEGLPVAAIDLTILRERDRVRARDKRLSFSVDDVQQIFTAPVWQGCQSSGRRRVPGEVIIRDALYWLPLIAAYTGARREEIAGLQVADLRQQDGIWLFDIRENANRGLKNATSRRLVPLHPHLIEMGLLDHHARLPAGNLFPDLRRKARLANLGDSIDNLWRKVLDDQLGEARQGKSFHSLRHYVTDQLRRTGVEKWVRLDLLGHAGEDIEDEVYGEAAPLAIKLAAIKKLPRVM